MIVFGIDIPLIELMFVFFIVSIILLIQSTILVYVLLKKINQQGRQGENGF